MREERYKRVTALRHLQKAAATTAEHTTELMTVSPQSSIYLLSAMPTNTGILLLITLWASVQHGLGLPVGKQLEVEVADGVPTHRERTKRCACNSLLDSECHYFCHLDIIWVNTPSKTTVYGLGGALSRRKRSTFRCTCANPDDQTCSNFCHHRPDITSPKRSTKQRQLNLLSILRVVMSGTKRALEAADSEKAQRKNPR